MRLVGITLPGNGAPVVGSVMVISDAVVLAALREIADPLQSGGRVLVLNSAA